MKQLITFALMIMLFEIKSEVVHAQFKHTKEEKRVMKKSCGCDSSYLGKLIVSQKKKYEKYSGADVVKDTTKRSFAASTLTMKSDGHISLIRQVYFWFQGDIVMLQYQNDLSDCIYIMAKCDKTTGEEIVETIMELDEDGRLADREKSGTIKSVKFLAGHP